MWILINHPDALIQRTQWSTDYLQGKKPVNLASWQYWQLIISTTCHNHFAIDGNWWKECSNGKHCGLRRLPYPIEYSCLTYQIDPKTVWSLLVPKIYSQHLTFLLKNHFLIVGHNTISHWWESYATSTPTSQWVKTIPNKWDQIIQLHTRWYSLFWHSDNTQGSALACPMGPVHQARIWSGIFRGLVAVYRVDQYEEWTKKRR